MCPSVLYTTQVLAGEGHSLSQLTELQRINFIGYSRSVSLFALASDLGWCEDWSCSLIQRGGDLVDVVQTDHGEDEAAGQRQKGHGISDHAANLVLPRANASIRERIQAQV